MKDIYIQYNALTPISHIEPGGKGKSSKIRKMKIVGEEGCDSVAIVSAGSIKGLARRDFMKKHLKELDLMDGWGYSEKLSPEVIIMLLNGGTLHRSGVSEPDVKGLVKTFNTAPFIGLLGGCYKLMIPGRLAMTMLVPITASQAPILEKMGWPFEVKGNNPTVDEKPNFTRQKIAGVTSEVGGDIFEKWLADHIKVEELTSALKDGMEAESGVADRWDLAKEKLADLDDSDIHLIREYFNIPKQKKGKKTDMTLKEIIDEICKKAGKLDTNQMIYPVMYGIPAGTKLHSMVSLTPGLGDDDLMELAFHGFVQMLLDQKYLGGLKSCGFGRVVSEGRYRDKTPFDEAKAEQYWQWVKDNKESITHTLLNLGDVMFSKVVD